MAVWETKLLWGLMCLLAGAVSQSVNYPGNVCAVKGSTVTLPCSFTPVKSVVENGKEVLFKIVRVAWCQKHPICQGTTPKEYYSMSNDNNPRYKYLGDMVANCTLQITDLQKEDDAILRFRVEADSLEGTFTGTQGVKVNVIDQIPMEIKGPEREFKRDETATLHCTSPCTFHQLKVTWSRDGNVLQETGPTLQLPHLTAKHSGNYTCSLKGKGSLSQPYRLNVESSPDGEAEEKGGDVFLIVGVLFGVLLAVFILILVSCIVRRKRAALNQHQPTRGRDEEQMASDDVKCNILPSAEKQDVGHGQEAVCALDEVSYAPVHFKHKKQTRPGTETEETCIYSSVVIKG